jgi:hypothetical protein
MWEVYVESPCGIKPGEGLFLPSDMLVLDAPEDANPLTDP